MASVKKRTDRDGKTTYLVRWRDEAGRQCKKSFDKKLGPDGADAFKANLEHELRAGTYVDLRAGKVAFRDYAEEWRLGQPHRPHTVRRVRSNLEQHVYPSLGTRPLVAIKPTEIQALVGRLSVKLRPSSVRIVLTTVRSVFAAAVRDKLIPVSPAAHVKRPTVHRVRIVPLTVEQVEALAEGLPGRYRALVATASGLGLRPGEVYGLRVGDVDFLRKVARIEQQIQPDEGVAPLKNASAYRTIPVPDRVIKALAAHLQAYPSKGLVFTHEDGSALDDHSFKHTWRLARRRARLGAVRLHDLRHFYASVLIGAGRSVKEVSERLGHSSAAMTLDVYSHLWPKDDDGTRGAIDDAFAAPRPESAPIVDLRSKRAGQTG